MCDFTLVSYKMIRFNSSQFDTHFCFFSYARVCVLKQIECVMECPPLSGKFVSSIETDSGRLNNYFQQRKLVGLHVFRFTFVDT